MIKSIGIKKIKPAIQSYAWGGTNFIAGFLGIINVEQKPMAEAWYGDHLLASSTILDSDASLRDWIQSDPKGILGEESVAVYGPMMPFLLKILDVKDMLSLQLHPTKSAAEIGYALENKKGISLHAPQRNYKDANHKPELLYALSDFWMLQGFAPMGTIHQRFQFLLPSFPISKNDTWQKLMDVIWSTTESTYMECLQEIASNLPKVDTRDKQDVYHWIKKALGTYPFQPGSSDRGILILLLMHVQYLAPGMVGYQAPGVLHAYLEGQNIELMSNSDNVLRGGLTPKHIDPMELMNHVNTNDSGQDILTPIYLMENEVAFNPPVKDFMLKKYEVKRHETKSVQFNTICILLVMEGILAYADGTVQKGESLCIPAYVPLDLKCITEGAVYFVACGTM